MLICRGLRRSTPRCPRAPLRGAHCTFPPPAYEILIIKLATQYSLFDRNDFAQVWPHSKAILDCLNNLLKRSTITLNNLLTLAAARGSVSTSKLGMTQLLYYV